ncbi:MAG: MYXO-CTERM sorting domain-containing protein [Myxococcota bacterium]
MFGLRNRVVAPISSTLASLVALLAATDAAAGDPGPTLVEGRIVAQSGDTPTGGAGVLDMRPPFVNAQDEVGFVGDLDDGDHYVWVGDAVVWQGSDDAMVTLGNIEFAMDSDGAGAFVYAVDVDGDDALYTDLGVFAIAGSPITGIKGSTYTFLSSPSMTEDGALYFVGGIDDNDDGETDRRGFFRSADRTEASVELLLAGGDMVDGSLIDNNTTGINFSYALSEDAAHSIHVINTQDDTTMDAGLLIDGSIAIREGDDNGAGDNWDAFDLVSINASGNYLFTGDTDGDAATDEFIAYNGVIAIREGDTVVDAELLDGAQLRYAALSDFDQAMHAWGYPISDDFTETMFFACDAADIAGSSIEVFTLGDELDIDGDGMGDYVIADIPLTFPADSRGLGNTPFVYSQIVLDDGKSQAQAIVEFPVSCCGNGAVNAFEECDDGNDDDTDDCLAGCIAATCGDGFVQDGVEECDDANDDDTDECPTNCLEAACGDGFLQDGVEECDDGNDDDTDECVAGCVPASCGDGFVQDGVEECDDGNTDDGDECNADCTLAGGVDDTAGDSAGDSGVDDGPSTLSQGSGDEGGDTDTDTDSGSTGGADDGSGCSCQTSDRPLSGIVWAFAGLGLLGLRRRRRS